MKLPLIWSLILALCAPGCEDQPPSSEPTDASDLGGGDTLGPDAAVDTTADPTEPDGAADALLDPTVDPSPDASERPDIPTGTRVGDLVLPATAPPPDVELPEGLRLRVVTFNLHGGGDASAEAIGTYLGTVGADLVGLQECPAALLPTIAESAGFEHFGGDGNALLAHALLDDVETIALEAGRGFIRAHVTLDGVDVAVYAAHIGWDAAGDLQMRELVDDYLTLDPTPHLVLLGDFNDEHDSTEIAILEEAVAGAFEALGWYPGQRISWPATEFDGGEGSQHIDLVFTGRALTPLVLGADVVNLSPVLSDHKPVWVDLLFPRTAETPFETDPFAPYRDPWRAFPPEAERPQNLLVNPGAEDGLAGWEVTGEAESATWREEHGPRSGARFFTGFEDRRDVSFPHSSGAQTVDLSAHASVIDEGRGSLLASAWITTGYQVDVLGDVRSNVAQPYDDGEVLVEALDADGGVLLRQTSGRRDTLGYRPFAARLPLPPGTRAARLTWLAHHKPQDGPSNDAIFDDLYLGFAPVDMPDAPLAGNLLRDPGGEAEDLAGWETSQWQSLPDLQPYGLTLYPPWSFSGRRYLFAGSRYYLEDPPEGPQRLAQTLDLAALAVPIDADEVALRWGGHVRTWAARTELRASLEILDRDGRVWGTVETEPIRAAEWTPIESLTRVPRGTAAVRLVVTATLGEAPSGAYADEMYVIPERVAPPE